MEIVLKKSGENGNAKVLDCILPWAGPADDGTPGG